jgi:hypothetical protein
MFHSETAYKCSLQLGVWLLSKGLLQFCSEDEIVYWDSIAVMFQFQSSAKFVGIFVQYLWVSAMCLLSIMYFCT